MRASQQTIFYSVTISFSLRFLKGQLGRLEEHGWRVLVSAGEDPTTPGELEAFARQEKALAIRVPMHREISPRADLVSLARLFLTYRKARPTVINVGTPKAGLLGGLAGVAARVPIRIYTLHGLRLETATGAKRQLLTAMERLAMACAHRVVCVSPSLRERVHELGLAPASKTVVLGAGSVNGVPLPDPAATLGASAELRRTLPLPEGTPVVGFVGRFTRDKGIAELMAAYRQVRSQFPATRLLLVGDYEAGDPVPADIRKAIESDPSVIHVGFVPDVTPYYPLMSVLALPTYREGLGLVALEAAAAGVPAVTTDATGARDAVQEGVTGWRVPVGDSGALARALLEALTQPEVARARGAAGYRRVREEFAPEVVQQHWKTYYQELLAARGPGRGQAVKRPAARSTSPALLGVPLALLAGLLYVKQRRKECPLARPARRCSGFGASNESTRRGEVNDA
ncbi:glycosyltransferase family 1 protein [Deinococcus metallilatus]|uniref:Glycosyltransferase family 4 protein n=1 Tax=Deinococcus metallilatus TaxID=1211322 RepID=A0AAJ5F2J0_9DEIO|nr:glycosyltransferase family 4 protein [Deinococcus metallilatus]MBB5297037.1 glycosyltransferase involved in cell wall biosynthesis [Deinococcus metallilatus]QBY07834.1 glycosyltransferase family 1 protein [Deinococcus metallilatus]RXJ13183.1 glycosyltransferase family 1 protein [Deinococcus metallilatus]TLK23044.1 glycosyltransferase family 4 protein [Deinococcus metallilatus]GMA16003.1 hypothetical protein GCM10025871_23340 [Deinococcus metallilatus]